MKNSERKTSKLMQFKADPKQRRLILDARPDVSVWKNQCGDPLSLGSSDRFLPRQEVDGR